MAVEYPVGTEHGGDGSVQAGENFAADAVVQAQGHEKAALQDTPIESVGTSFVTEHDPVLRPVSTERYISPSTRELLINQAAILKAEEATRAERRARENEPTHVSRLRLLNTNLTTSMQHESHARRKRDEYIASLPTEQRVEAIRALRMYDWNNGGAYKTPSKPKVEPQEITPWVNKLTPVEAREAVVRAAQECPEDIADILDQAALELDTPKGLERYDAIVAALGTKELRELLSLELIANLSESIN